MAEQQPSQHIENEIAALEASLAEKRRALSVAQTPEQPSEREIVKEAVRERMEQTVSSAVTQLNIPSKQTTPPHVSVHEELIRVSPDKQVALLVNVALEQGIDQAVNMAKGLNDPFVYDSLHDSLTTMFYDELIKRNKLEIE